MPDNALNKLVEIIAAADASDLKLSALKVAGRVGSGKDRGLVGALVKTLDDASADMRCAAVEALGLLHVEEALSRLEAFIRQGGVELEPAVHAAVTLGGRGARLVGKLMEEATPSQRARMAQVLAKSGTGHALVVTAHALLDADPKVVESAARSLAQEVPNYTPAQRQPLIKFLTDTLQGKGKLPPPAEAAVIRILGTLRPAKVDEVFWKRLDPSRPAVIRAAALQALGAQARPPSAKHLQLLFHCAADSDFHVVAPALMILKNVPVETKHLKSWLGLMASADVATRRFVIDKLRGLDAKEWARALADQINHSDRNLRDEAMAELCGFASGRDVLLANLQEADNLDERWSLARALAARIAELSASQRTRLFTQACALQDDDDRRAGPLWFLLRHVDGKWVQAQIEKRAAALREKRKYAAALVYYRLLAQDPALSEDIRFDLAATGLKQSAHDLSAAARQDDPCLKQFARLLENAAFDLIGRLKKTRWLDAADLFYLGFHFVEQSHRARDFGKQVLELVLQRHSKSDEAKNAKRKLKSEALG